MRIRRHAVALLVAAAALATAAPSPVTAAQPRAASACTDSAVRFWDGHGQLRWTTTLTGNPYGGDLAPPVSRDGVAYVDVSGTLIALRIADGSVLWRRDGLNGAQLSWLDGNRWYVATAGAAAAVDVRTGAVVWQYSSPFLPPPIPMPPATPNASPRAVHDNVLNTQNPEVFRSAGAVVYTTMNGITAVNLADGSLRWLNTMNAAVVAVGDAVAVAENATGAVYGLDMRTGRKLWTIDTRTGYEARVWAGGSLVLVQKKQTSFNDPLLAIDARSGKVRWTRPASQGRRVFPIGVVNGDALVETKSITTLVRLRASDGKPVWSRLISSTTGTQLEVRGVTPQLVLTTGDATKPYAHIVAHRWQDGTVAWREIPPSDVAYDRDYPFVGAGVILSASVHVVAAYSIAHRRNVWFARTDPELLSPPGPASDGAVGVVGVRGQYAC